LVFSILNSFCAIRYLIKNNISQIVF